MWAGMLQSADVGNFILDVIPKICACQTEAQLAQCVGRAVETSKAQLRFVTRALVDRQVQHWTNPDQRQRVERQIAALLPRLCECRDRSDVMACVHTFLEQMLRGD